MLIIKFLKRVNILKIILFTKNASIYKHLPKMSSIYTLHLFIFKLKTDKHFLSKSGLNLHFCLILHPELSDEGIYFKMLCFLLLCLSALIFGAVKTL